MDEREPVGGFAVPRTQVEFEDRFGSEAACRGYLERVRWPDGFVCPNPDCAGQRAWLTARGLYRCAACGRQTSATAGTIFAGTRKPLRAWFKALWLFAGEEGVSAEVVRTVLGLGSYQTAWAWLHRLRRALATAEPERLRGIVELDVISLASVEGSARRRASRPPRVAIALEVSDPATGRVRLAHLPTSGPAALERFVAGSVAPGAIVRTTSMTGSALAALGCQLDPVRIGHALSLLDVRVVDRRLDTWIVETHHGAIRRRQLDFYVAEFAFRFNERTSLPGVRFQRLLEAALVANPRSARSLVAGTGAAAAARATSKSPSGRRRGRPVESAVP